MAPMSPSAVDVVIIGSGAGGGASAWALARHGVRVLVLEAGPFYDPAADYGLDKPHWEQSRFPHKARRQARYSFGPMQKLEDRWRHLRSWNRLSGPMNPTNQRIGGRYHHVRGVGGTTLHFTGEAHRLHPAAMKMYSRFGVAADWPLDYAELEPFYGEAERVVGVAGPPQDPIRLRSEPYPLPAHRLSYASAKIEAGCRKLGLHWVPNRVAALSAPYDGRPACNYCANCNRGCPITDKGSADVTFIRKALASGSCTVKADCQVTQVEAGPSDRVRGCIMWMAEVRARRSPGGSASSPAAPWRAPGCCLPLTTGMRPTGWPTSPAMWDAISWIPSHGP